MAPPKARPAPLRKLHYLTVDGTDPVDAVVFGNVWRVAFHPFWENLLRALPMKHGFRHLESGKALAMRVTRTVPGGGMFVDECLLPQGPQSGANPNPSLTDDEIRTGNLFSRDYLLSPGVTATGLVQNGPTRADIVFLSGHGYTSGEFKGNSSVDTTYFDIAHAAAMGRVFDGPRWLFLSNCNTLHPALNQTWLKLFGQGSTLRGVVGFKGLFPEELKSAAIFLRFIQKLKQGESFLDAWRHTIESEQSVISRHWTVLARDDAANDGVSSFLSEGFGGPVLGDLEIKRFDVDSPTGLKLEPQAPLFTAGWVKSPPQGPSIALGPENRHSSEAKLRVGDSVTIVVNPPAPVNDFLGAGPAFRRRDLITITLVYIRLDHPQPIDVSKMFRLPTRQEGRAVLGTDGPVELLRLNDIPRNPARTEAQKKTAGVDSWRFEALMTDPPDPPVPPETRIPFVALRLVCTDLSALEHSDQPIALRVDLQLGDGRVLSRVFPETAILAVK
jgi:hypothetical protein